MMSPCQTRYIILEENIPVTDFTIDGKEKMLDPKGHVGKQLDCRMLISTIPKKILYPYFV